MSEDDDKMMSADDHMFKNTAYLVYILYILFRIGKSIENNFDTSCKVVIL